MWVGVLGPVQVKLAGTPVTVSSRNQRCLLAVIALQVGSVVPVDHLVDALWGEDPPASAVASLRTYVYRLRQILGEDGDRIVTRPPGYLLDLDPTDIDAVRFERLVRAAASEHDPDRRQARLDEAIELWRGPALGEFAGEAFARGVAARLEELRRVAVEDRLASLLELGDHVGAVADLEEFVETHPLRERPRVLLMEALAASGRHADALAVSRHFRTLLGEELGLDIPAAVADMEQQVLRHDVPRPASAARSSTPASDDVLRRLPGEVTGLVGRDADLADLHADLDGHRLVTLTGPGGVGKTRLAVAVVHDRIRAGDNEVWWAGLASVVSAGEVAPAVATALGVRLGDDIVDAMIARLADRSSLLVLDSAEHVADAVAELVVELARACLTVTVLVTSRARLGVPGERVRPLRPLPVDAVDGAGAGPAVRLFLDRANAARPDVDLAGDELAHVISICRQLDGLPLAVELAASRIRSLNPSDLAARLDRSHDLLVDAGRSPARHRDLPSVVIWSTQLLSTVERRLFARLSLFAGSFTLDAVEQVCGGDGIAHDEVVDLLARLVDASLVTILSMPGETRYLLLETVRAHGRDQLAREDDQNAVADRHARYYLDLATDADHAVRGADEATAVRQLDANFDDVRAAHRWSLQRGDVDLAMRLMASLFRYALWRLRLEVFAWAEQAATLPGADRHPAMPTVAGMVGWGAGLRGDADAAERWVAHGLGALNEPDDPRTLVPLEVRMHLALWEGDLDTCLDVAAHASTVTDDPYDQVPDYVPCLALTYAGRAGEALTRLEDVESRAERHGNPTMRALVHYARAEALLESDPDRALQPLEEAAELATTVDNHMVLGVVDVALVSLLARHGRPRDALKTIANVVSRLQRAGNWTHLWTGLRSLTGILAQLGQDQSAGVLLGAVRHAASAPPAYGEDARRLADLERQLRQRLGDEALRAAVHRGRTLSDREAIAFSLSAIDRIA